MINNIIWDVDGTLFDTYPAITYAFSKALNELGLPVALNVIDGLARQSLQNCLETLSRRYKVDHDLLRSRYVEAYQAIPLENQPPFPGAREVCDAIRARGGLNIIATHRSVESTRRLLAAHNFTPLFSATFSVEQGHARKPDPAMFAAALRQFDLDLESTLAVGDREIDVRAGRAAGLRTCSFGRAALAPPADYRIDDYSQLLAMFEEGSIGNSERLNRND